MSSQRHRQVVLNYGAACTAIAEKQPAAGYLRQIPGPYAVPVGPAGGPLQGSSLAGPPPAAIPSPSQEFEHPLAALGLILAAGQRPPEPPEGSPTPPVLDSLEPDTAVLGAADFTLHVHGSGFTESSVINFAGQPEPIVFISPEEITTVVKPTLGWGAVTVQVSVADGGAVSNELPFTFTEGGAARGGRAFPLGPFNIVRVDDHSEGLGYELVDGDVRVGDTVTIEAVGNSNVNGSFKVLEVDGNTVVLDNDFVVTAPIEGKGRLTVTGGA